MSRRYALRDDQWDRMQDLLPGRAGSVFMLNGMTEENGGTRIVPGSHRFGRHPDPVQDAEIET
ncbi:MAG: phytanoyl-CoA dioxygenase family protein, partial [Cyanobacteria bacterium P01_F01_bin.56]